jgi:hypothetical protein
MRRRSYFERVARVPVPGTPSLAPPRSMGRRWEPRQQMEEPGSNELRPAARGRTTIPAPVKAPMPMPAAAPAASPETPTAPEVNSPAAVPEPSSEIAMPQPSRKPTERPRPQPPALAALPLPPERPIREETWPRELHVPQIGPSPTAGEAEVHEIRSQNPTRGAAASESPVLVPEKPLESPPARPQRTSAEAFRPETAPALPAPTAGPRLRERTFVERVLEPPAGTAAVLTVSIGSIEVVITPPPAAAPPAPPPSRFPPIAPQPASHPSGGRGGMAPGTLARGFVSRFGFRQE